MGTPGNAAGKTRWRNSPEELPEKLGPRLAIVKRRLRNSAWRIAKDQHDRQTSAALSSRPFPQPLSRRKLRRPESAKGRLPVVRSDPHFAVAPIREAELPSPAFETRVWGRVAGSLGPVHEFFVGVLENRTIRTSPSNSQRVSSSSIIDCTFAGLPPPDPAPINGIASDLYPRR